MKSLRKYIVIIPLLFLLHCSDKHTPSAQEKVTSMLTASTWNDPTVTVDDVDYSSIYKNFNIKFDKNTYTTSSGAPVWAASGTWMFLNQDGTLIQLDNNREIQLVTLTDDALELSFSYDKTNFDPGRLASVKGKQKFKLKKKK